MLRPAITAVDRPSTASHQPNEPVKRQTMQFEMQSKVHSKNIETMTFPASGIDRCAK